MAAADRPRSGDAALALLFLLLGLTLLLRARPLLAAWHANLGAVHQARAELALYDAERAADLTLDQVRRRVDLARAERQYGQALLLDTGHAQARVQLAQIALSRAEYAQALAQARAAWQAGHDDWRTRLTLGDALVAEGHVAQGVEVVRGLPRAEARFEAWAWYRHWIAGVSDRGEYRRAADASRAVVLLNPANERAATLVKQAEQKAQGN
jgi:hypothetical protein